jgi:hypothetical protein
MANMRTFSLSLLGLATLAIIGCGPDPTAPIGAAPTAGAAGERFVPSAEAGIRVEPGDATALLAEAKKMSFQVRPDPFALRASEIAYDRAQFAARLVETGGFYQTIAEEPEPPVETFEVEPQPTRRLAGIILGDSITALIDMGTGQLTLIRPGQRIEGTEWVVQSIDEEKAILRRVGSNKRPKYVVVRLQPDEGGGGGNTGGNTGGGGQQGRQGGGSGRIQD